MLSIVINFFLDNPVLCEEYLQAHNAEIIAGPIELSSCMDLTEQGGSVTLTSPKLFKAKGRNFLIHIKTMVDLVKDGPAKTRGKSYQLYKILSIFDFFLLQIQFPFERRVYYVACSRHLPLKQHHKMVMVQQTVESVTLLRCQMIHRQRVKLNRNLVTVMIFILVCGQSYLCIILKINYNSLSYRL